MIALCHTRLQHVGASRQAVSARYQLAEFPESCFASSVQHLQNCKCFSFFLPTCSLYSSNVWKIRWEKEVGGGQGSPGFLAGLWHSAGSQPGEFWSRAVHQTAPSPHCRQLLWAEASPGRQRSDMDGAVPGVKWAGSPPGGPGPSLRARMLSHCRCSPAAHLRQLRPSSDELDGGDSLHHRKRGIHSEALPRLTTNALSQCRVDASAQSHMEINVPDISLLKVLSNKAVSSLMAGDLTFFFSCFM